MFLLNFVLKKHLECSFLE